MTSKMFLDIVGVITTSKLSILSTFQGGAVSAPPMSSRVKKYQLDQLHILLPVQGTVQDSNFYYKSFFEQKSISAVRQCFEIRNQEEQIPVMISFLNEILRNKGILLFRCWLYEQYKKSKIKYRAIIFKDHIPKSFFSYGSLTQDANFEEI